MALPKLTTPEYTLVVPSTGEEIKYRPFLVKEEKVLLIAMEGEDEKQINDAVMNLVKECTFGAISNLKTPVFDVEYIFLKIRSKSVGETVTLSILCPDDKKTRVDYKLNLDEVEVQMSDDHTNIVELTDEIKLIMKYPTMKDVTQAKVDDEKSDIEQVFDILKTCIVEVHHGDDITNIIDVSPKDLDEFFESMTQQQFELLQEFFNTMPKLRHVINVKNPKTKKKNEILLEGLGDFFV